MLALCFQHVWRRAIISIAQTKSERGEVLTVEKENEKDEEEGKRIFWKRIKRDIFLTKYLSTTLANVKGS